MLDDSDDGAVERTTRLALGLVATLLAAGLAVLLATGVWLTFHYRPLTDEPYRQVHLAAAVLTLPLGLVVAAMALAGRRRGPAVAAVVSFLALGALAYSGTRMPWATTGATVTTGNERGVFRPIGDGSHFAEAQGSVMGSRAHRAWVVSHLFVLPAVVLASGGFLVRKFLLRR